MTEAERKNFFELATSRAPGKRQIKPTAAVLNLVIPADEDDDEDFIGDTASGSGSGSDSSDGSDEDEEEEEVEDEDTAEQAEEKAILESLTEDATGENLENAKPICSLCLNMRETTKEDEIMQCDGCGLTVHESCYLPDISDEESSSGSSASTEPWFCEPCTYGCVEPPHCELCPDRHGAFKRSDVGGRWVHLVCALYTRSITFGDIDHLAAVSWQELDHRNFGRKSCAGCSDKLDARTGISTRCELGLCKNYYHVTCAQRLGLLVDLTEIEHEDEPSVEPRYINCKKHSNPDNVKVRRTAYLKWIAQEERRMLGIRRKKLSARDEQHRVKALERAEKAMKTLVGVTICWPGTNYEQADKRTRRARHLHTSPRFLEAFREKAELIDIDKESFEQEFIRVHGESLPFLNPGFSKHFVEYFNNREKHVHAAEDAKLTEIKNVNAVMKKRQDDLMNQFKELEKSSLETHIKAKNLKFSVVRLHEALKSLGVAKITLPAVYSAPDSPRRNRLKSDASQLSPGVTKVVLHSCDECKKSSDQHKLIHCDSCKLWFHLGCLDPPLERMPKKANYSWFCSRCCESSDDDEEAVQQDEEDSVDGVTVRKLRQRNDLQRTAKWKEAEEHNVPLRALTTINKRRDRSGSSQAVKRRSSVDPNDSFKRSKSSNRESPVPKLRLRNGSRSSIQPTRPDPSTEEEEEFIVVEEGEFSDEDL